MRTRIAAAGMIVFIALASAVGAGAHDDPSPDSQRCDTWARATGHPGGHEHPHGSDIDAGAAEVHAVSGHYVVRSGPAYVEIVGGQSYRGPDPSGNDFPGQGGFVQAEVDAGNGTPDADLNVAFFGPDADHPPTNGDVAGWAQGSYAKGCVNAAGQQVEQQSRNP